jgi:Uma2 family endonuclease
MTAMTATSPLPYGRPLTRDDLAAYVADRPDDGHRYELLDGVLVVSPAPRPRHQQAVLELAVMLREGCPHGMQVFVAPFAVGLGDRTEVQPDVLVARTADLTDVDLPTAPVLAVEVLSPSTRWVDLGPKRALLESAGCEHYWVVDVEAPRVTAWELRDGSYDAVADVIGEDVVELERPFPVRFRPAALARWRGADEET